MKPGLAKSRRRGFTGWDAMIVLVTLVLAALAIPYFAGSRRVCSSRISCVSNLKQIGLSFRMWANDHDEHFPWEVSTNAGGTKEFLELGGAGVLFHFRSLSNELTTPKVLACPTDRSRTRATSFCPVAQDSSAYLSNAGKQISYFVGLQADQTRPQTLLSGDRNLQGGALSANGLLTITPGNRLVFTPELHQGQGNIGLADGSAMQCTSAALNKQVQSALSPGRTSLSLAMPR